MPRPRRDITGQTFGRITVRRDVAGGKNPKVLCLCSCGKEFTADKHNVIRGNTNSCGCLKSEKAGRYVHKKKTPEKVPVGNTFNEDEFYIPGDDLYEF
ncbi:MAG: hypothetical protein GF334_10980 [Candidatus Altiarchaeales archaeon]|nr:hypothetical protein [Candidatus Altiarchaeales archaeon]